MQLTHPRANRLGALALCSLAILAILPVTACQNVDQQIQADGQAIAASVQQIAALEKATNPQLSDQLSAGATALLAAVQNFKTGNTTADINAAANIIQVAMAAIPQTAVYAPLVPIAVAALDTLLANLPASNTPATPAKVMARAAIKPAAQVTPVAIPHRLGRSVEGDFKAAWNAQAAKIPGALPIK